MGIVDHAPACVHDTVRGIRPDIGGSMTNIGEERMTEIDLSDINIDLTYQDGLRLSELYGQLGKLQTQMDNLSLVAFQDQLWITIIILVLALIIGFVFVMALSIALDESEHCERYLLIGIVLYIIAVALVVNFELGYIAACTELRLEGDIKSTQMQIDAILMKYGWEGI